MDWETVTAEIDRLATGQPVSKGSIENARLLASVAQDRFLRPDNMTINSYRSTICLHWTALQAAVEIEVADGQFEFYRFDVGETEIRHFVVGPDGEFPSSLGAMLDAMLPLESGA